MAVLFSENDDDDLEVQCECDAWHVASWHHGILIK